MSQLGSVDGSRCAAEGVTVLAQAALSTQWHSRCTVANVVYGIVTLFVGKSVTPGRPSLCHNASFLATFPQFCPTYGHFRMRACVYLFTNEQLRAAGPICCRSVAGYYVAPQKICSNGGSCMLWFEFTWYNGCQSCVM